MKNLVKNIGIGLAVLTLLFLLVIDRSYTPRDPLDFTEKEKIVIQNYLKELEASDTNKQAEESCSEGNNEIQWCTY